MMDLTRIKELANCPKESVEELADRMVDLKSKGARILECIRYVMINQGCSLTQAQDIVVNSSAWVGEKDAYLQHQEDMFLEFLEHSKDRIESIEMTITPDGTKMAVHMKQEH